MTDASANHELQQLRQRVTSLEETLMYSERMVAELNEVVCQHQVAIEHLQTRIELLQRRGLPAAEAPAATEDDAN